MHYSMTLLTFPTHLLYNFPISSPPLYAADTPLTSQIRPFPDSRPDNGVGIAANLSEDGTSHVSLAPRQLLIMSSS